MKKKKFIKYVCAIALLICLFTITCLAHSGRTDSNGGHYNHFTGEYHYHHGYSAHQHYDMDGDGVVDCPYEFKDNTNHSNTSNNNNAIQDNKTEDVSETSNKLTLGDILLIIIKIVGMSLALALMGLIVWGWVFIGLRYLLAWLCEKILKKEAEEFEIYKISIVIIGVVVVLIASFTVLGFEGII